MARRKGRLTTSASNLVPLTFPTGSMLAFGGTIAPEGWLMCDGAEVPRADYAALYAAIGDANGEGDGSTTFLLPDARGRAIRGSDDMGTAQGAAGRDLYTRTAVSLGGNTSGVGSVQLDTSRRPRSSTLTGGTTSTGAHNHTLPRGDSNQGTISLRFENSNNYTNATTTSTGTHNHNISVTGGGDAESTMKNTAQNFIIKI